VPEPAPYTAPLDRADIVLVRHGETTFNARHLLNGDVTVPVPLSEQGREQCRVLAGRLAPIEWAAVYVTRFARTAESAALLVPDGPEPAVLADLDDIALGELDGRSRDDYVEWRRTHGVAEAPAGGESRCDALRRYARGMAWLAAEAPSPSLVVTHDQPIRYLANALAGLDAILGHAARVGNAMPYPFERATVARGAAAMAARLRGDAQ
jgi:probable phosphoglycerate mutase